MPTQNRKTYNKCIILGHFEMLYIYYMTCCPTSPQQQIRSSGVWS